MQKLELIMDTIITPRNGMTLTGAEKLTPLQEGILTYASTGPAPPTIGELITVFMNNNVYSNVTMVDIADAIKFLLENKYVRHKVSKFSRDKKFLHFNCFQEGTIINF